MKVSIKDLGVSMDVKTKGVEIQVRDNNGKLKGDFYVTSTKLIWCPGQTSREKGHEVKWDEFIKWITP